jgi:molybdenum cofactor cytidylyltransferase
MPGERTAHGIAAVIPAAGESSRLGANKLLVELNGEPLVRRAARRALAAGLDPVIVVLGFEADRIRPAIEDLPARVVVNSRYEDGMPSTLRAGIEALPSAIEAAVVVLPDMPLVTTAMLTEVIGRYLETRPPLVVSLYGETPAPPALYSRSLFPALAAAKEGGRGVIRQHRHEAVMVRWPADLLVDLDLPSDLARVRALRPDP